MLVKFRDDYGQDCPSALRSYVGLELVFSGCLRAVKRRPCEGCHSQHLWPFLDESVGAKTLDMLKSYLDRLTNRRSDVFQTLYGYITIMGGEPLDQRVEHLDKCLTVARQYGRAVPVVIFTGYNSLADIPIASRSVVGTHATYIKFGEYKQGSEGSNTTLASKNQYFAKVIRRHDKVDIVRC